MDEGQLLSMHLSGTSGTGKHCQGGGRGKVVYTCLICRVGQNRIYTPYMTVYLVILLPKIPYIHRIYMVLANPINLVCAQAEKETGLARSVYI